MARLKSKKSPLTARTADKHRLYEWAVQCPEADLDFADRVFRRTRGRLPSRLREDFCGTAATASEWVARRKTNTAVGVDLSAPTLAWGKANHVSRLPADAANRLSLLCRNVLSPGRQAKEMDMIFAMNFSYFVFKERDLLLRYLDSVRRSLNKQGMFVLDHYGGYEAMMVQQERRRQKGFTYVWDQAAYNPINGDKLCHIHFEFRDGSEMKRAFKYDWRLWTLPELQDAMREVGFRNVTVYWEGDDHKGGGNGVFRAQKVGDPCASYICYVTGDR
ncbi:MAG: class I SAM-dependent methyltransferase [Planctomycetes bacterium]|nr:class I SAM-dependent methyltransferase [Planctomycetota bacterium]